MSVEKFDLIVVGGGPAGLFAALTAASAGMHVAVLEKNAQAGKKLLVSGSGQCNVTHAGEIRDFPLFFGKAKRFVSPSFLNFSNNQLVRFFSERSSPLEDRGDGKIFPVSRCSRDILDALLRECHLHKVRLIYKSAVKAVKNSEETFHISAGRNYESGFFLIACGGKSYPSTGSEGDGYGLAESLGHSVIPPVPALTPVFVQNNPFTACSGISFNSTVQVFREKKKVGEYEGDLLLTHKGLSGPVILNNSRHICPGDSLKIRIPENPDRNDFQNKLLQGAAKSGKKTLKRFLTSSGIPERLVEVLLKSCGIREDTILSQLNRKGRIQLLDSLYGFPVLVQSLGGFNMAMATAGGVSLDEVTPRSMESKIVNGLYFAGEVLDVDGDTGGYNLQFAFSSGKMAADNIVKSWKKGMQD
jgi:predicted Rossmann fold flavoprotein